MYLALPSGAERKYDEVQSMRDMELRERMCRSALSSLARTGRTRRIVYGIISSAIAAYTLQQHSDYYGAVLFGALALREFIRKSPAEKTYRDYLQMSERQKELALSVGFGMGRHGGVKVGLSLTY